VKTLPVSELKHSSRRHLRAYPEEGTRARAVYDRLYAYKGRPVFIADLLKGNRGRTLGDLRDYYGCDIRRVNYRHHLLAGEWFGSEYVDYVNAAIDDAVARGEAA
jgi:hypothetical protein